MSLKKYAEKELKLAGLFDIDSDYDGMIGKAVMELIDVFSKQGHSGCSAGMTRQIPDDWMEVGEKMWQCTRSPSLFSTDNGKTHYDIDVDGRPIIKSKEAKK